MSSVSPVAVAAVSGPAVPAVIRNGSPAAKSAYATGVAFEQILMSELTQELSSTVSDGGLDGSPADGSDGSDGSDPSGTGVGSSDPASSAYADLLPQALSSAVSTAGGSGLAMEIAQALDPSIQGRR